MPRLAERERYVLRRRFGLDTGTVWALGALAEAWSVGCAVVGRSQKAAEQRLLSMLGKHEE